MIISLSAMPFVIGGSMARSKKLTYFLLWQFELHPSKVILISFYPLFFCC